MRLRTSSGVLGRLGNGRLAHHRRILQWIHHRKRRQLLRGGSASGLLVRPFDATAGYARAICDESVTHFGVDRVFIDVDYIQPGHPFAQVIQHEVGVVKVLLVLTGRRWPRRNAMAIDNTRYADDMHRLLAAVREALGEVVGPAESPTQPKSCCRARPVT